MSEDQIHGVAQALSERRGGAIMSKITNVLITGVGGAFGGSWRPESACSRGKEKYRVVGHRYSEPLFGLYLAEAAYLVPHANSPVWGSSNSGIGSEGTDSSNSAGNSNKSFTHFLQLLHYFENLSYILITIFL